MTPGGDNNIPWQVAIWRPWGTSYDSYSHKCGGVIIGENIILSAAHCFVNDFTLEDVKKGTKPSRPLNDKAYQFIVGAVQPGSAVSKYI